MKEAGTAHWESPNEGATNERGFTALPGGYRFSYATGAFYGLGIYGDWWTSTVYDPNNPVDAWPCELCNYGTFVGQYLNDVKYGKSIRCVKD